MWVGELMFWLVSLHINSLGRLQSRKKGPWFKKLPTYLSISVHVNLHIQLYKITFSHVDNTCCISLYIVSIDITIVFVFFTL